MAYVSSSGQVAEMAKCSRPSQTDVLFVAMDPLLRDLCRGPHCQENTIAMSQPCVVDLSCRNSIEPRPDRSHVSELRSQEFGDLIFLDHGSTKIGHQTVGFLNVLDGATTNLTAYPCKSSSPPEVISKLPEWMDTFSKESEGDLCRHGYPSSSWYAGILSNA